MPLPPLLGPDHVLAITGGLTGIGRAIALLFLSHGASVSINYLASYQKDEEALLTSLRVEAFDAIKARRARPSPSPSLLTATTTTPDNTDSHESPMYNLEDVPLLCIPGDVSDPATGPDFIAQTVARFGRVDTFISNAGICRFEEFLDITPGSFSRHLNTNLSGAFYAVQAAARQMSTQSQPEQHGSDSDSKPKGGSIIGVSSISALVGGAQQCHYTPTKAGVLSLMQSCATALGKHGIRCNALLPGTIRTQLNEDDLGDGSDKKTYMEGRIPLGRLGEPADMAGPALWLAIPELSGYVSGAAILVDGGAFVNFQ